MKRKDMHRPFSRLSIRTRTIMDYLGISALTLAAAVLAFFHMKSAERSAEMIAEGARWSEQLGELQSSWSSMMSSLDLMLLTRQSSLSEDAIDTEFECIASNLDSLDALLISTGIEEDLSPLRQHLNEASAVMDSIGIEIQAGRWATARILHHTDLSLTELFIEEELEEIRSQADRQVEECIREASGAQRVLRVWVIVIMLIALCLGPLGAILAARHLVRPLEYLAAAAGSIQAEGLSEKLHVDRSDEIGELADAFNSMTDRIHMVMNGLEAQLDEHRKMREALTNSEARYRSLFQHSPISLWQLFLTDRADPFRHQCDEGSCSSLDIRGLIKVIDVNSATLQLLEVGRRNDLTTIDRFMTEDAWTKFREAVCALAGGASSYSTETSMITSEGHLKYVLAHFAVPPDSEQGFRKVFLSLLDMTERKEIERALRESEEQYYHAQKMEAVGRLTGGIAHDFNNLLTVIMSNCDIAMMEQTLPRETEVHLRSISEAALRAASVTQQLMAFSRQQVSNPVNVDLNELVNSILKMLRTLIGENINCSVDLQQDIPPVVIDAGQMEQVVMNLVVNARDAMPEGGDIQISTSMETVTESVLPEENMEAGGYVTLTIADNGYGMTREVMDRVFDPFYTTKELGKGTGLGLASAHGIVRNAGGFFHVNSQPGQGTVFTVYLPASAGATAKSGRSSRATPDSGGTETILLVEDEQGVRDIAARALKHAGYTVIEAENGVEAFRKYAQTACIDLIVSDVILTGKMNGIEIARKMREREPGIRVLLMSGYVQEAFAESGDLPAGTSFIAKPFSLADFLGKVRETLDT